MLKQQHINTKYQHFMLKYHHILKVIRIRQLMPSIRKHNSVSYDMIRHHIFDTTLSLYSTPLYYTHPLLHPLRYIPYIATPSVRPLHYILSTTPPLLRRRKKKITKYNLQCFLFLLHFQAYNYIVFS